MKTNEVDKKIEKAREKVNRAREAYDKATKELKALEDKQKLLKAEEILSAIEKSGKSFEEIFDFISAWSYLIRGKGMENWRKII